MTDLIERLRDVLGGELGNEAADEIERLKAELETERCLSFRNQVGQLEEELAALKDELAEAIRNRDRFEVMFGSVNDDLSKVEAELAALKQPAQSEPTCHCPVGIKASEFHVPSCPASEQGESKTPRTDIEELSMEAAVKLGLIKQTAQSEPVAYIDESIRIKWLIDHDKASKLIGTKVYATPQPAQSEPFFWHYRINDNWDGFSKTKPPEDAYDEGTLIPLYTTPQPAQSEPVASLFRGTHGIEVLSDYGVMRFGEQFDVYRIPQPSAEGERDAARDDSLLLALEAASAYIDVLGGDSKSYRIAIAAMKKGGA